MADYYSHRDPRKKGDQYLDYDTGTGAGWIWAVIILLAIVGLVALGSSGGGDGTAAEGAAPVPTDLGSIDAPATTTVPTGE